MKRRTIGSIHRAAFARRRLYTPARVPRFVRSLLARHGFGLSHGFDSFFAGALAMPLALRPGVPGSRVAQFVERRLALNLTLQLRSVYRADPARVQAGAASVSVPSFQTPAAHPTPTRQPATPAGALNAVANMRGEMIWVQPVFNRWQPRVLDAGTADAAPQAGVPRDSSARSPRSIAPGAAGLAMPVVSRTATASTQGSSVAVQARGATDSTATSAVLSRQSVLATPEAQVEQWPERVVERLADRVIGSIDRRVAARRERLGGF